MYKILIDENIPMAAEAFSQFGEVTLISGNEIGPQNIQNYDILLVRSVTKVNKSLLGRSTVKFVGTATIGTDHVDTEYLRENNIKFASAKGCNSQSVVEYVFSGIFAEMTKLGKKIKDTSLGIVGMGDIGSKICKLANEFGFNIIVNDPPLAKKGLLDISVDLNEVLKADIITFHVPLTKSGEDKTFHLLNSENINIIKEGSVLINSSRGAVVDNKALLECLLRRKLNVILDVWENEPEPDIELVKEVTIGTPHIAGYSFEGKVAGTKMLYDALCEFLGAKKSWTPLLPHVDNNRIFVDNSLSKEEQLAFIYNSAYNNQKDNADFRRIINLPKFDQGAYFNGLRKNYPIRRELSNYHVITSEHSISGPKS